MHLFESQSPAHPRGVHDLYPPDRRAPVEEYLPFMAQAQIDHAIVVSLDEHDSYVSWLAAHHGDRFSIVGVMDPGSQDPVGDYLRRRERTPLVGYRIWSLGSPDSDTRDLTFFPLLERMARDGVAAWFYSSPDQVPLLERIVKELPDLVVVLNHLAFTQSGFLADEHGRPRIPTQLPPATLGQALRLAHFPQVSVHFSGQYAFSHEECPYRDTTVVSDRLLESFGARRLLWGSDWPWIKEVPGYLPLTELVELLLPGMSENEIALVMGGNAARILSLGGI